MSEKSSQVKSGGSVQVAEVSSEVIVMSDVFESLKSAEWYAGLQGDTLKEVQASAKQAMGSLMRATVRGDKASADQATVLVQIRDEGLFYAIGRKGAGYGSFSAFTRSDDCPVGYSSARTLLKIATVPEALACLRHDDGYAGKKGGIKKAKQLSLCASPDTLAEVVTKVQAGASAAEVQKLRYDLDGVITKGADKPTAEDVQKSLLRDCKAMSAVERVKLLKSWDTLKDSILAIE